MQAIGSVLLHAWIQDFSSKSGGGGGGPGPYVVFVCFLVLNLFYRSPVVYFDKNYTFPGVPEVSYCLFPIEPDITCDFPGGS